MIEAKLASARRAGVELAPTTLRLARGRHALLGRPNDGGSLLLSCIAGDQRIRRGELRVLGGSPTDPKVRARVGYVPLGLALPDVLRVDETIAMACAIRGDAAAAKAPGAALELLGLGPLAHRRVQSLDPSEVRAVALAEALASKTVSVLLIEEPFVSLPAPAAALLPRVLAAQLDKCVVIATASALDAARVAEDFALFDRGRLLRIVPEAPLRDTRESPRIHVVAENARELAAALAKRPEVERLELSPRGVLVTGGDSLALSAAINAAIIEAGVPIMRIEPEPASLEALRADALAQLPQKGATP